MQTYLEKFGSTFLVAAFIPSLAFVMASMVAFGPITPAPVLAWFQKVLSFQVLGETSLLLLVMTIILGFTLSSMSTFLYKLFEGYFFLDRIPYLTAYQRRRALGLQRKLIRVKRRLKYAEKQMKRVPTMKRMIGRLKSQQFALTIELQSKFPPVESILPTRFGNILRAAEAYPNNRYRIDAVPAWTRLIHVIPLPYYEKIDASNNRLAFLVNCSVLSLLFALLCVCAAAYQAWLRSYVGTGLSPAYFVEVESNGAIYQQRIIVYLLICGVMFVSFWLFYQASLTIVSHYGAMIRSAYDLFRFDLLAQLKLKQPASLTAERTLWEKISDFWNAGERFGKLEFSYDVAQSEDEGFLSTDHLPPEFEEPESL